MKKILMLSVMSLLMIGMVSAVSVSTTGADYNKKDNIVTIDYEVIKGYRECSATDLTILDHKDNVVGSFSSYGVICSICIWSGDTIVCRYVNPNPRTYDITRILNLIPKNEIKGLGNLKYEVTRTYTDDILASGRLK